MEPAIVLHLLRLVVLAQLLASMEQVPLPLEPAPTPCGQDLPGLVPLLLHARPWL